MGPIIRLPTVPARWPQWPRLAVAPETGLHWILRVAVAWCCVGHGAFGILNGGKPEWLAYFHVFGIPDSVAWRLMPLIGTLDVGGGALTLCYPLRAVLAWAAVWGTWTALLRPLAGQGMWEEFFERAGNYGVPFAMLYLSGLPRTLHSLAGQSARPLPLHARRVKRLAWILRLSTALLLIGHGGYGAFMQKQVWASYLGAASINASMVQGLTLIPLIGWFEIALGLAVLVRPFGALFLFLFVWKASTEWLRIVVGEPIIEFVERGGSYGAPLALFSLNRWIAHHAPRAADAVGDPTGAR